MKLSSSAALLVLLAVVGCGGDESSFTQDYNEAVKPLAELRRLDTEPREFGKLAAGTRRTRQNLERLEPPAEVRQELDTLVLKLAGAERALLGVARATKTKDPVRQRRAAKRLVRSSDAVQRAEDELRRAVEPRY